MLPLDELSRFADGVEVDGLISVATGAFVDVEIGSGVDVVATDCAANVIATDM